VLLFLIDVARRFRMSAEGNAGNVWNAGTLEWLPNGNYSNRSIPIVTSREPLWDQPGLAEDVDAGRYYLPNAPTGGRETIITSPLEAKPQFLLRMPMPGWAPPVAAWFTAGFFLLLTVKLVIPAMICGVIAIGGILHWGWSLDAAPLARPMPIGGGIELPAYMSGPRSQAWWAVVVLLLVSGSLYGCAVFSYLYLWTVSPATWPATATLPDASYALASGGLLLASSLALGVANRLLAADRLRAMGGAMVAGIVLLIGAVVLEIHAQRDLSPLASGYGAAVYLLAALAGFHAAVVLVMAGFALARAAAGKLGPVRRVTFDNVRLFWHYTVGQSLVGVVLVHGFPRVAG
jgi:heme/copper-type cytochrome/quinol oxidase subunit 3